MAIIITGATGHFGRQVTDKLLETLAPEDLILITRKPDRLADYAARGARVRYGNFDEPESLAAAFEGGERMLLISTARVGTRVGQHGNAIKAAAAAGVRQIAYTSFVGIDPDNPALVVKDHGATEELLRQSGTGWTALRDSQYAEAMAGVVPQIVFASGKWTSAGGEGKVAFVSRADCVACAAAVLTTPGHENKVYNITGPELLSYREACDLLNEVSGRNVEYAVVSEEERFAEFDALGVPREASDDPTHEVPWCSTDMVSFEQAIRDGYFAVISNDVKTLTGRDPVSLREVYLAHKPSWPK